ncbi:hypothetical protein [Spirulina sp. 06S082]|uniref:hypothetical protein n=1 Tax=Spirulina sp. 06S082 TaxID=3110248 RepID=UPI002B2002E7|nr:hypothetical protein [Spirulina sp. 06S082]MEA5468005.1 hypothetical protein [Spirulina sp. 06S082]
MPQRTTQITEVYAPYWDLTLNKKQYRQVSGYLSDRFLLVSKTDSAMNGHILHIDSGVVVRLDPTLSEQEKTKLTELINTISHLFPKSWEEAESWGCNLGGSDTARPFQQKLDLLRESITDFFADNSY